MVLTKSLERIGGAAGGYIVALLAGILCLTLSYLSQSCFCSCSGSVHRSIFFDRYHIYSMQFGLHRTNRISSTFSLQNQFHRRRIGEGCLRKDYIWRE